MQPAVEHAAHGRAERGRAIGALVAGTALWGCIWYPYRLLDAQGVGGIWALLLTEIVAIAFTLAWFRRELATGFRISRELMAIAFFSGVCNVAFVLGTLLGEVMRVTLLLYLAPLWTVVLSRWLLAEHLSAIGRVLIAVAMAGAVVMLWHPEHDVPWPASLADWLGLVAGLSFAAYNVLVKKATGHSVAEKSLMSLVGTLVVGAFLLPVAKPLPDAAGLLTVGVTLVTGFLLFVMIPLVQYGLMRLPANRASVIMLSELLFAGLSAWVLAGEAMGLKEWIGGSMIVVAGALSARLVAHGSNY
jgi:drug/metabolite transporter (DMT)-like permease